MRPEPHDIDLSRQGFGTDSNISWRNVVERELHKRTTSDKIRLNISYNRLCDDDVPTPIQWLDTYSDLHIDVAGNNIGWNAIQQAIPLEKQSSYLMSGRITIATTSGHYHVERLLSQVASDLASLSAAQKENFDKWAKRSKEERDDWLKRTNDLQYWTQNAATALEEEAIRTIKRSSTSVTTYEDLRLLPNLEQGRSRENLLEFDGIFTVKMRKKSGADQWVLVLLEAKLTLTPELIDVDSVKNSLRYNSEDDREKAIHRCLPTRVDRFKSVWRDFADRADVYMKNHSSATINDKLRRQVILFRSIYALGDVVVRVAVASKQFRPGTEALCRSKGYWCLTYSGTRFDINLPAVEDMSFSKKRLHPSDD